MPAYSPIAILHAKYLGWTLATPIVPGSISETKSANYEQHQIRGRSTPIYAYTDSAARTVSVTLILAAIGGTGGIEAPRTGKEVYDWVQRIKSLEYPLYGSIIEPPSTVTLKIGNIIYVPEGVVTSVDITWGDTYDSSGFALKAEVSITVEEIQMYPSSAIDVMTRGY